MRIPHVSHQHRPPDRDTAVTSQPRKQIELFGPQYRLRVGHPRPSWRLIYYEIAHDMPRGCRLPRDRASKMRPQPSQQLRRPDRLRQVIVGARLQSDHNIDSASRAVRITIITLGQRDRRVRHTATPSTSGRPRSRTTRSTARSWLASASAERPSRHQRTHNEPGPARPARYGRWSRHPRPTRRQAHEHPTTRDRPPRTGARGSKANVRPGAACSQVAHSVHCAPWTG